MAPQSRHGDSTLQHGPVAKLAPVALPTKAKLKAKRVCTVEECLPFQVLPLLHTGYRLDHTVRDAWLSLATLHLDTLNIWTHLLGLLYLVWASTHVYDALLSSPRATPFEYFSFAFYIACCMCTMVASVCYHTLRCVSPELDALWLRADVGSIMLLILSSQVLGFHQAFICQLDTFYGYMAGLALILCFNIILASQPGFQANEWDGTRNAALATAVAFGVIPCIHWYCIAQFAADTVLSSIVGALGGYFVGFLIFVFRIPERWYPRRFDLVGTSHTLWHCFVVFACAAWLHGVLAYHQARAAVQAQCTADGLEVPTV